ncbi:MAG: S41 family peptidase [Clostridia bacterium]
MKNKEIISRVFLKTIITVVISVIATLILCYLFVLKDNVLMDKETFSAMYDTRVLSEIADDIENQFYGEVIPSKMELVDAAARKMVDMLNDPYAEYYTKEQYEEFLKGFNGEYVGLGILIDAPNDVGALIVTVYEDSAAEKAGMQKGDILIKANGVEVANISIDALSNLLSGVKGTILELELKRGDETLNVSATIDEVNVKRVHSKMLNNGGKEVGYIRLDMFSSSASDEFNAAIKSLTDGGMKALIIDIRNNPGGSLLSVVDICDAIMDGGEIVRVGRSYDEGDVYLAKSGGISLPITLLINENSASASEIMAAAMKEHGIATLIGERTYGKGIVQTTLPLNSNEGYFKLTTDAYFTPNGNNIHKIGVAPDIELKLTDAQKSLGDALYGTKDDSQLNYALENIFKD